MKLLSLLFLFLFASTSANGTALHVLDGQLSTPEACSPQLEFAAALQNPGGEGEQKDPSGPGEGSTSDQTALEELPFTCSGCAKTSQPPRATQNPSVSVPYQWVGRGRAGIRTKRGKCEKQGDGCDPQPCKILGTLTVKNNSTPGPFGRPLYVRDSRRGPGTVHVPPGGQHDIVFGDPATGTYEDIACGEEIVLEFSSIGGTPQVPSVREMKYGCGSCDKKGKDATVF